MRSNYNTSSSKFKRIHLSNSFSKIYKQKVNSQSWGSVYCVCLNWRRHGLNIDMGLSGMIEKGFVKVSIVEDNSNKILGVVSRIDIITGKLKEAFTSGKEECSSSN